MFHEVVGVWIASVLGHKNLILPWFLILSCKYRFFILLALSSICLFILVICLGGAVNARVWSLYLDSLCNGAIANFTMEHIAEWTTGPPIARLKPTS